MGKNVLKYGGKSGVLPKPRPIFKTPIRQPNRFEQQQLAKIEEGYAEGVPVPKINGKPIPRMPKRPQVITVEQRIKWNIDDLEPKKVNYKGLTEDQKWKMNRDQIRRDFLREAYLKEAERLKKIDELTETKRKNDLEAAERAKQEIKSEHIELSIPTIEKLLEGKMVKISRTREERQLRQAKKDLNRRSHELISMENQAEQILDLYHASGKFITTIEELEKAIHQAFEVDVAAFDSSVSTVQSRLFRPSASSTLVYETSESMIVDKVLGGINGKPGLEQVKEVLSGEREEFRRRAQLQASAQASSSTEN
ncbi:PET123 [[Candida] subhashii]|uniref:PET123 n=1 Tax=[Candida] subhashii TaxID=561895 RepID=A0A8J5QL49_9ASCO|nr:PET123 [[Candida] subhashii]KAG7662453.1 PET123 [[Candida] subhashii]